MITRITKTFFNKVVHDRKAGMRWEKGIFFSAADGRYYRTDSAGPTEVKQVYEFKKKIKKEVEARPTQQSLLGDEGMLQ